MSLASLRDWLAHAPMGTLVPVSAVLERLDAPEAKPARASATPPLIQISWRERVWTCHPDTRLGVTEMMEVFGRGKSWVYSHTSPASGYPVIPHRKLDGALVFRAGDVRDWMKANEQLADGTLAAGRVERRLSIHRSGS